MSIRTKWSTIRFTEVYNIIDNIVDNIKPNEYHVFKCEISDKKYIERIIKLRMFSQLNISNSYEAVWTINLNKQIMKEKEAKKELLYGFVFMAATFTFYYLAVNLLV